MQINFEWDPTKAKANERKHHITFGRGAQIFLDLHAISLYDEEHSIEEERWVSLGTDANQVVLVVIHTWREIDADNVTIRIISARRATRREADQYRKRETR